VCSQLLVAGWPITVQFIGMILLSRFVFVVCVWFMWALVACTPGKVEIVGETDEKQYQLAKAYQKEGRTEDALSAFLRVIDARRDAPESHFEAGYIYLQVMQNPLRAIYHFERYLEFKYNSPRATEVTQLIETAEKQFVRRLPAQPYEGELDRIDLMELVKSLRQENERLKRGWIAAQKRVQQLEHTVGDARRVSTLQSRTEELQAGASVRTQVPDPDPATVPRSYTVQSGDSLSTISRQVYGTPSRWIDIYQANRDRLASENALRVGQELRIP